MTMLSSLGVLQEGYDLLFMFREITTPDFFKFIKFVIGNIVQLRNSSLFSLTPSQRTLSPIYALTDLTGFVEITLITVI